MQVNHHYLLTRIGRIALLYHHKKVQSPQRIVASGSTTSIIMLTSHKGTSTNLEHKGHLLTMVGIVSVSLKYNAIREITVHTFLFTHFYWFNRKFERSKKLNNNLLHAMPG